MAMAQDPMVRKVRRIGVPRSRASTLPRDGMAEVLATPEDDRSLLRMLVIALLAGVILWTLLGWGIWALVSQIAS